MLIGKRLIFIHNPRTGGMSVQAYLRRAVPGQYFPIADTGLDDQKKAWFMHQGLEVCFQYANRLGFDPFGIPALVCIRNPYSLTLSGYLYLKQRFGDSLAEQEQSFPAYLKNLVGEMDQEVLERRAAAHYGPFSRFMTLGGDIVPDNLTVARTESLADDVEAFLKNQVGVKAPRGFPHKNASEHGRFSEYYSEAEEELVYRMYRNVFDGGLYERYAGLEQGSP